MLTTTLLRTVSGTRARASQRLRAFAHYMMSTKASEEHKVLFESNLALRKYALNRPEKLNALDDNMLSLLRPKIEEWSASNLCKTIIGTGVGKAFCCGGDVANVVKAASDPNTRPMANEYFKREFEMDYILAALQKPYVAILDGITMGGGVGLSANAPFRIATENTVFAMPETKIGYFPDVGASHFLSRLDGELGTYLALTSEILRGRAVFELGFATHYISSRRIPFLLERLASLEDTHISVIDKTIEEFSAERLPEEAPTPLTGDVRVALDSSFRHNRVEEIVDDLRLLETHPNPAVSQWAKETLTSIHSRSPTSLKVSLEAIRRGRQISLLESLQMEIKIAGAFCNGATGDFATGVHAVLVEKTKDRPQWSPETLEGVSNEIVSRFFSSTSPYKESVPSLSIPDEFASVTIKPIMKYALPTEEEIGTMVRGSHKAGGGTTLTLDELVGKFESLRNGKLGVREKVTEVVQRKCEIVDNGGDGNAVWLKWKHSIDHRRNTGLL